MKKKKQGELIPLADILDRYKGEDPAERAKTDQAENSNVWAEPQLYLLPFCVPQDKQVDRFRSIK